MIGTAVLVLLLLVAGLLSYGPRRSAPLPLRLGAAEDLINSLVWIAADQGYFSELGLAVQMKEYPSGKRALAGLLADEVDLVTTSEVPFMKALQEHDDLRLLATVGTTDDEIRIVARKDRGIREPRDLSGKVIGTQEGSAVHFFLSSFLLQHYIPATAVTLRFMQAERLPAALAAGEIDAFSMREPYIHQARELLGDGMVVFAEPGLYRKTFNLVARLGFARANPEPVRRLIEAVLKAEEFAYRHPRRAQAIIARIRNLPLSGIGALWDSYSFAVILDQDLLLQLQQEEQWLEQALGIPRRQRSLGSYVYAKALDAAASDRNGIVDGQ